VSQSAIFQWIKKGVIKPEAVEAALVLADEQPDAAQWPIFVRRLLLQLGLLSLVVAMLFFTAYNWQAMGYLVKFALVQAALILWLLIFGLLRLGVFNQHFKFSDGSLKVVDSSLLIMLFLTVGGLLALFGQVYQTGADPWQLFAIWALLVSVLVLVSGQVVLWILWSLLLNIALALCIDSHSGWLGQIVVEQSAIWLFLGLNSVLLVILEVISQPVSKALINHRMQFCFVEQPWARQLQALVLLLCATYLSFGAIFEWRNFALSYGISALAVMTGMFFYYRYKRFDLAILALWMLTAMTVSTALLIKMLNDLHFDMLLVIAVALIVMTAVSVRWLKALHANSILDKNDE